jgi:hypothetical protein
MKRRAVIAAATAAMLFLVTGCGTSSESSESRSLPEEEPIARSASQYASGERVTISGRVRRVGSEPFTYLVITDADGIDWYLDEIAERLVLEMEQSRVTLRGTVHLRNIELANGTQLGVRHELHDAQLRETTL